jgi:hypothetical protein
MSRRSTACPDAIGLALKGAAILVAILASTGLLLFG